MPGPYYYLKKHIVPYQSQPSTTQLGGDPLEWERNSFEAEFGPYDVKTWPVSSRLGTFRRMSFTFKGFTRNANDSTGTYLDVMRGPLCVKGIYIHGRFMGR